MYLEYRSKMLNIIVSYLHAHNPELNNPYVHLPTLTGDDTTLNYFELHIIMHEKY